MTRAEQVVSLCQELIQRPSLSGQEKEVATFIKQTMLEKGFDTVTIDKYGSVLGTITGSRKGKSILLDGHIDTVDISNPSQWAHAPYGAEIVDGKIYGRGTSDMKGSVAAMILGAAFFAEDTKKEFAGTIYVSCTVHEECFEGISAREITKAAKPDFVVIGEATTTTLKIGQRGRAEIVVETEGKTCHSSNPDKGINAVYHMIALIDEIKKIEPNTHPVLGKGILELTDIISSPYPGASVVPGQCRVTYDRRTLVGETAESVLQPIQEAIEKVKQTIPNLKAKAYIAEGSESCWTGETISAKRFFPAWMLDSEEPLVQKALSGLRKAGIEAPLSHFSFCTNGSHFCGEQGIPTIGFGPSQEDLAHVIDEYIEIEQLTKACKGFEGIIAKVLTQD
jgi:putative selenium metabolism hydrolase